MMKTVGSICSGIEAASVAWSELDVHFEWFSENAEFPSQVLAAHYPRTPNVGDMNQIPDLLRAGRIIAPDVLCAGTPCQAFSLAGKKHGLADERGNLTLRFVDIVNANDAMRRKARQEGCIVFWENVEGVLSDKTNAFGCLISALAGVEVPPPVGRWPQAGSVRGKTRNIAWRVLDAKYFGLPQQRRRLYVIAAPKSTAPEAILFERHEPDGTAILSSSPLEFQKDGVRYEVFREYTDCLYSAYATKWNGNAAAYNGSLFVVQDGRLRRFSPLECERLMGFPDGYTAIEGASRTSRYRALGNSWAVPVVRWVGERLFGAAAEGGALSDDDLKGLLACREDGSSFLDLGSDIEKLRSSFGLNCTEVPETPRLGTLEDIVSPDAPAGIYLSPVGCGGILRRRRERGLAINDRLELFLESISREMPKEEIERRSRIQKRGRLSA